MNQFAHEHPILTFLGFWIAAGTVGTVAWAGATAYSVAKLPPGAAGGDGKVAGLRRLGASIRQPWHGAR